MVTLLAWTNYLNLGLLMTHSWVTVGHDKRLGSSMSMVIQTHETLRCTARIQRHLSHTLRLAARSAANQLSWRPSVRLPIGTWCSSLIAHVTVNRDCSTFCPSAYPSLTDANRLKKKPPAYARTAVNARPKNGERRSVWTICFAKQFVRTSCGSQNIGKLQGQRIFSAYDAHNFLKLTNTKQYSIALKK